MWGRNPGGLDPAPGPFSSFLPGAWQSRGVQAKKHRVAYTLAVEMDVVKWCAQLYLISVCVASKMYVLTPIRGRSLEDIHYAVDDLASTFKTSGHDL